MGFDYFYGFVGGDASQWQPNLFRNTTAIYPFQGNPGWNLETAMADEAIQYIKQLKEIAPGKPLASSITCRAPPMRRIIRRRSGSRRSATCTSSTAAGTNCARRSSPTRSGWASCPPNAKLTPWPKELPEWDSLGWEEKKLFIKQADVYRGLPRLRRP